MKRLLGTVFVGLGLCAWSLSRWPAERLYPSESCRTGYHSPHTKRSSHARTEFKHSHPCPSTGKSTGGCPGYVIDHVQPLKRSGADTPSNMQWQTTQVAKAKDKWE